MTLDLRPLTTWPEPAPHAAPAVRERWLLVALVAVACATRLVQVGFSFDTDEVFSVRLASRPLYGLIDGALGDRSHPPLHVLLLHFWLQLFGSSEAAARSLSIAASAGFLFAAHAIARRVAGPLPAAFLILLIAVSPFFTYYGQQARPYSLIAALSAVNLLLFMRAMDRPARSRGWLAWSASTVLLIHSQYMAVLLLGVEALVALVCLRRAAWWPLALLVVSVLTVTPWAWAAMGQHVAGGDDPLDLISWMSIPSRQDLAWQFVAPFGAAPLRARTMLAILLATIVAGGAVLLRRGRFDAQRVLILLAAVGAPTALYVIAHVLHEPVFAQRQLINASFCQLLLLVVCAAALPRVLGGAALGVLLLCATFALPSIFPAQRNPDWPAIAAYFDYERDGAAVRSAEPWIADPLLFYRHRGAVYGATSLTAGAQGPSTLLLCRPQRCRPEDYGAGFVASRSWRWGKQAGNELRLYERVP